MTTQPNAIRPDFTPANDAAIPKTGHYVMTLGCFNAATTEIVRMPSKNAQL